MIKIWIFLLIGAWAAQTLDDLVAPFSRSISQDVAGNMTASLLVNHNGRMGRMSPLHPHRLMVTRIRQKFDKSISSILKSHILQFLHRGSKTIHAAKKATLFAIQDLQKNLIHTALMEKKRLNHSSSLVKRDFIKNLILLETVIVQIYQWKNDHPDAVAELLKMERSLFDLVKPGVDGKFNSSELAVRLKELNAAGLDEFWIYPVVFGAGSISMAFIFGMFKWIMHGSSGL